MNSETQGLVKHHVFWGLGLGVAVSASIQILTWVGLGLSHVTWIWTYVLVVVFAVLAGRSLRRRLGSAPRLLQAVVLVVVMILVSRLIYQTYMFVYINFVDPNWVDRVAEFWSTQLREAGTSEEQIGKNIASFRKQWETRYVFTLGIVSYGIAQFVLALVTVIVSSVLPGRRRSKKS